jgi:glycosyltransferase involved in cell wall biosynthesis
VFIGVHSWLSPSLFTVSIDCIESTAMKLPTLSIIIPNYNHGHFLPVAVNAILKQSAQPLEVIIIDDGSTDDSVEIIQNLASENPVIKFYRNEKNSGVCFTINRGIDLARGDYVFFSAADDEILPGFLEKSLNILAQHPQAGLSCTIGDWREEATGLNWHVGVGMADTPSYLSPKRMVELERSGQLFIPGHTTILKKAALIETGKLIPELKLTVDWFIAYVMGYRYGICFVPEALAVFKILPKSYYQRVRQDAAAYREVLARYQDAAAMIQQGGSLYIFGWPMLKLVAGQPAYRRFLTFAFLRKCLWHCTKLNLKKITPAFVGNLYFKIAGYRAQPTKS